MKGIIIIIIIEGVARRTRGGSLQTRDMATRAGRLRQSAGAATGKRSHGLGLARRPGTVAATMLHQGSDFQDLGLKGTRCHWKCGG